jgi:hypothetical protein
MVGFNTFENWKKGEFVFHETYVLDSDVDSQIRSVSENDVLADDLLKIKEEQIDFGLKQKQKRFSIAKKDFSIRYSSSIAPVELFKSELQNLKKILLGHFPKHISFYYSETFGFKLTRMQLDGITEFYYRVIENDELSNYTFVASNDVFPDSNEFAPQGWAYFIYELYMCLLDLKRGKIARINKFLTMDRSLVALNFANGEIFRLHDEVKNHERIAELLNLTKARPYISDSFSESRRKGNKSIFNKPKILRELKEYCEFFDIELCEKFLEFERKNAVI